METESQAPKDDGNESPLTYGRQQFEKEAGVEPKEEYAAEIAPALPRKESAPTKKIRYGDPSDSEPAQAEEFDEARAAPRNKTLGIVALVLAAISLFFMPAVLGPAAAVVGFAAYLQGNRTLGLWSIALGLISIAAYFLLVPYYA
jgi:hypothetical protein